MKWRHLPGARVALALACLALAPAACLGHQNIRIQVNNENLQNPPYLLEALKQASAVEGGAQLATVASSSQSEAALAPGLGRRDANPAVSNLSSVKEEAIEELLDLEPESVLGLSPESLIDSAVAHEAGTSEPQQSSSVIVESIESAALSTSSHETRKQQLPVTSSHLKRPVVSAEQLDRLDQEPASERFDELPAVASAGAGAKSRVSPSVAMENESPVVNLEKKKAVAQPPDTWEASQVMQGVTNASQLPAVVRRQYGHQTRTRITLGGGYTRDKLAPLGDPTGSSTSGGYQDERALEKPYAPLERPNSSQSIAVESSNVDSDYEQSGSGVAENSRHVEVPKRIILSASAMDQDDGASQPNRRPSVNLTAQVTRRRDSRCPANGVTSLEHPTACDKYFLCQDGQLTEQTCPNGLLYGTRDTVRDYCVHRWEAICGDKSIPNPISSPGCRWQNGIFQVQGSPKCVPDFYECKDGQYEVRKCPLGGQVYDDKTKSCRYAEQVGCTQEALADFRCPPDDQTNTYWPFPRYFLNERALIHCVNDKPEIIRCRDHERVDMENLFCVPINKSETADGEHQQQPEMTARRTITKKVQPAPVATAAN